MKRDIWEDVVTDSGRDHSGLVEEARERAEKATPGPWRVPGHARFQVVEEKGLPGDAAIAVTYSDERQGRTQAESYTNAQFIAHAREDVPALCDALSAKIAEVERERGLEEENEVLRRELAQAHAGQIVEGSGSRGKPRRMDHMVSVRLDGDLIRRLRGIANKRGTTLSDLLREGAVMVAEANNPSARPNDEGDGRGETEGGGN